MCICIFYSLKNFAQPTANFTVNATHACNSLTATFTDLSTGSPTTWFWNFGNGQTSTIQNPTILYSAAGVYTVSLTVTNGLGGNTITKTNFIVVDKSPVANFAISSTAGCLPFSVSFVDQSGTSSGSITNWSWDLGDGTTTNVQNPIHTYFVDSSYTVKLKVQSSTGCVDSLTLTDTVKVGAKPVVGFSSNQKNDLCASIGVKFNNLTTGNYTSCLWYFGDGDTTSKFEPSHKFSDTGFMNVKLVVYNFGCADSLEIKNFVHIKPPIVKPYCKRSCDSPYTKYFGSKYIGAKHFNWDFGDGVSESTDKTPSHTYQKPGLYYVTLTASGSECDYKETLVVTVIDEHPSFTFTGGNGAVCSNQFVKFNASNYDVANIDSLIWNYGDGNSSLGTSSSSNHLYSQTGTYNPSLIIRTIQGCYDTIQTNASLAVHGPDAQFSVDSFTCTSFKLNFKDMSTGDGSSPIVQWQWDYGDGNSGTYNAAPFIHQYNTNGIYKVSLKVTDASGCTDTFSKVGAVNVIQKPVASLVIVDTLNCLTSPVSFFDKSSGQQLGRVWSLGDGDTASQNYFQHVYPQPGIYNAQLIIGTQQGCSDTARGTIRVVGLPDIDAGSDTVLCLGEIVNMKVTGAANYSWLPNPSLSCYNCAFPLAKPVKSTTYYVTGTDNNGCSAVDSVYVEVKQRIDLGFKYAVDSVCYGKALQLSAQGAELYSWVPTIGLNNSKIADPVATLTNTTSYTVIGTDSKSCFTDSAKVSVVVVANPKFDIIDTSVSMNAGSLYTIKTTASADVIKWQWTPAIDLSCNNCAQPQARIDKVSQYTGTAYNSFGCTASDKITIHSLCNNQVIFIPNTFSPNGDSRNDRFYPRGNGVYTIKSMRIFTKLGQPVFQRLNFAANAESEGWDGTNYGKKLPSDVYIYYIEVMCNNGTIMTLKGDITLLL